MLSERSKHLSVVQAALVDAHFKCHEDAYHPEKNPDGYINLGTAENHLLWDLLEPALNNIPSAPENITHYDYLYGSLELRSKIANYLEHYTHSTTPINPEHMIVSAGASAIIDMLAYILCDQGDVILIPAPYYSGFDADFKMRAGVATIPVPLHSENAFLLTVPALEEAIVTSTASGKRVKALLINSPSNPLGHVYPRELLQEILDFCDHHQLDCIVDEIYLNSVFGESVYTSVLELTPGRENIHYIYGFAKDFGLSGFKTGVYHSRNTEVITAMQQLSYFSPVSTHTQYLLTHLLQDKNWLQVLLQKNRERLKEAYDFLLAALSQLNIPISPSEAGIFFFVDLRHWLKTPTFEAEQELWQTLLADCRINLSPGKLFHCSEPGWFRLCFAEQRPILNEALKRLAEHMPTPV